MTNHGPVLILALGLAMGGMDTSAQHSPPLMVSPSAHQALAADLAVNARGDIALLWADRSPTLAAAKAAENADAHGAHAAGHAAHDRHVALTNLYIAISLDGGQSFGPPVKVNSDEGSVWGQAVSRPRVVGTADGSWHITYAANERHPVLGKTALTTHYTRSRDGAHTFESPRRLSALTDQDLSSVIHGGFVSAAAFGAMAVTEQDSLAVAWIDTRHMTETSNSGALYVNVSHDGGQTFDGERRVIDTGVCPCCQIMATAGDKNDLYIGSRTVDQNNYRAATVMRLGLQGGTSARHDIGAAPWQIEGCPLKPTVMTRQGQHVYAAVHSGGERQPGVIFSVSKDGGQQFTSRGLVHPSAAVSDNPSMATNGQTVALVWHAKIQGPWAIYYQLYDLDGNPLGEIQSFTAGTGSARSPVITALPSGHYVVAWQQDGRIVTTTLSARQP